MRARTILFALLAGSTTAIAQPGADLPPPEPPPAPAPVEAPPPPEEAAPPSPTPAPAPVVVTPAAPGGGVPPITINITNNNNGNNSNTNTQTNSQANPQTTTQTSSQANPQTMTAPVNVTTSVGAPGAITAQPGVRASVDHYELLGAKEKPARWITLGVTTALHGPPAGIRGSMDLVSRGAWSLGVAGSISADGDGMHGGHGASGARGGRGDGGPSAQAIGYLAWTGKLGRLDVRAQVGLGAGTSGDRGRAPDGTIARTTTGDPTTIDPSATTDRHGPGRLGMRAEAAVLVGLPLGKHLGLVAGPVISAGTPEAGEKAVSAQVMGGLRWGF